MHSHSYHKLKLCNIQWCQPQVSEWFMWLFPGAGSWNLDPRGIGSFDVTIVQFWSNPLWEQYRENFHCGQNELMGSLEVRGDRKERLRFLKDVIKSNFTHCLVLLETFYWPSNQTSDSGRGIKIYSNSFQHIHVPWLKWYFKMLVLKK